MQSYLVFRLYGPLASWGDVAVGEYRPTTLQPSKSAILGLIASALGIAREDEATHVALAKELGCAMYVEKPGILLRDYHTIQVPAGRKGAAYATRKDELSARDKGGARDLNTILSTRDYWCDSAYAICLWMRRIPGRFSLESIQESLRHPRYPLFLGRRSCPVSLPLDPQICQAGSFHEAYASPSQEKRSSQFLSGMVPPKAVSVYWDEDGVAGFPTTPSPIQSVMRRDIARNRKLSRFDERRELHAVLNLEAGK